MTICTPSPSGFRVHDFPGGGGILKIVCLSQAFAGRRFCRVGLFRRSAFYFFKGTGK